MKEEVFESQYDECTFRIRTGQSDKENWELIDDSEQNDIWFHVEGHPSCHVVLSVGDYKKKPHQTVIKHCAALCKDGSKLKYNRKVTIIYTQIKNVKKAGKPGSVTTTSTQTIKV